MVSAIVTTIGNAIGSAIGIAIGGATGDVIVSACQRCAVDKWVHPRWDGGSSDCGGFVVVVVNVLCDISGTAGGGGASRGNTSGPIYYYGR